MVFALANNIMAEPLSNSFSASTFRLPFRLSLSLSPFHAQIPFIPATFLSSMRVGEEIPSTIQASHPLSPVLGEQVKPAGAGWEPSLCATTREGKGNAQCGAIYLILPLA